MYDFVFHAKTLSDNVLIRRLQVWLLNHPLVTPMYYYECHQQAFKSVGVHNQSCFVAKNTVHLTTRPVLNRMRMSHLCVIGTLTKRKGLDKVLIIVNKIRQKHDNVLLHIIGDGEQWDSLNNLVNKLDLHKNVIFHGRIEDNVEIELIVSKCKASISYGQAGLSVLHSLAFGTPYVTLANAISGGEKSAIVNGKTGFLCVDDRDFEESLDSILLNYHSEIYESTYTYFWSEASSEVWRDAVIKGLQLN